MLLVLVFVTVALRVWLLPTLTLPKLRLVGSNCKSGCWLDPDPASETVAGEFVASLVMVSVALNDVAAFGVNETLRVVLPPAATETGSIGDARAKYFVVTEAPLMVTAFSPEFVAVTVRVFVVFGATLPKSRLAFPRTRLPTGCWFEPPALTP